MSDPNTTPNTTPTTIPRRFLDLPETVEYSNLSRSTILRYESQGLFPKRKRLGPGRVAWDIRDLESWADQRGAA
jgi:prophage regulatory protein